MTVAFAFSKKATVWPHLKFDTLYFCDGTKKLSFRPVDIALTSLKHQAVLKQGLALLMLQLVIQNRLTHVELWLELT